MTTVYPGAIDALTNPTGADQTTSPSHAGQHADANDAIEAIEAELGTDPAGGAATVKQRLDDLETIGRWSRITTAQVIPNNTTTELIFNGTIFENDPNSLMSMDTLTGDLTLEPGIWEIILGILWEGNAAGRRQLGLRKNAVTDSMVNVDAASGGGTGQALVVPVRDTSAMVLTVPVIQTSGGDLDAAADTNTFIAARLIKRL